MGTSRVAAGLLQLILLAPLIHGACFPAFFNFGDSTSDSGGIHATFPRQTPAEFPPYGDTYYGRPSNKYSDGRLLVDFLCQAMGLPNLHSAMQTVDSDYSHGANFATAGATVMPITYLSPFPLPVQYLQFLRFQQDVIALRSNPATKPALLRRIPTIESFSTGLYMIGMGGNDFTFGYTKGQNISQVQQFLPQVAAGLVQAVNVLYSAGARNIIVHDIEPHGCLPYMLTLIPHSPEDLDEYGCMVEYNEASQWFNNMLKEQLAEARASLPGISLHMLSTYDIKKELGGNLTAAGFEFNTKACCGVPSEYNYNLQVNCGKTKTINGVTLTAVKCDDPNKYTVWDGVHNTDAGNRYVAQQILTGKYFDEPFPRLTEECELKSLD
ncbi:hypothetical protein Mapa_006443 [Marchantia paleacea]|nr:hypothetical protein Mapa_006443 [Marchantia paleacea]